ncbi:hypothetical protein LL266_07325 [Vibrio anguillarum]|uniref:hypothetical protein n=1 Tax=Vibrio TaxID=662 RepID=UPI0010239631|nr:MULTISPECIES: hypothetical protein [Vibrio]MCC4236324.1 hypothetical protein [Vibrio anguillarum]MDT3846420.1 hypothetical protein [Vibrio anguillarum]RZP69394.1 hypothetical protein D8T45_01585 [Vibrio vulnificus]RZR20534.1 hypothetical protein D8T24_00025 [Vibrio vulnificus]HDY7972698.1 hypothetical protein [Vibrio vulnificus]
MSDQIESSESEVNEISKRRSKRKALKINRETITQSAMVEPLSIEDLVLLSNSKKSYFQRLRYFGCPKFNYQGKLAHNTDYIDMERDDFVRSMYRLFKASAKSSNTRKTYFDNLTKYIRWLDENHFRPVDGDYFHNELIDAYMTYWGEIVTAGTKKNGWEHAKRMLSFVLIASNRKEDARNLPCIKGGKGESQKTQGLDVETKLKPLIKAYFQAFYGFKKSMNESVVPIIHPIFNEQLFNEQARIQSWTNSERGNRRKAFKLSVGRTGNASEFTWINQFSRIAAMITFMFTGQNTTPILNLCHRDVAFEVHQTGKVYFNMEKARAKYLDFDTSIGFSPYARRFIESWLVLSSEIQKNSDTDWLFPYVMADGKIISFVETGRPTPQEPINKLTKHLGLPHATPRILRQTKIDTLMKVTEDVYLVSMSANNNVKTLKVNYSHGLTQDHERNLSASASAMFDIAKGNDVQDAVTKAKFRFHDVLSEYDYERSKKTKSNPNESQTPLGVRCQDNTKGGANIIRKSLNKSGIDINDKESLCTDFLECFDCPYHKLVAAVEDIWLMLSFRDTLTEMEQLPAVNSLPKERYYDLCQTIDYILGRFKDVSEENYASALRKNKISSHPLYASIYSLSDLLEVFS